MFFYVNIKFGNYEHLLWLCLYFIYRIMYSSTIKHVNLINHFHEKYIKKTVKNLFILFIFHKIFVKIVPKFLRVSDNFSLKNIKQI